MLPNPYTPGQTPHHLAGRAAEQEAIRDYLAPVIAYGDMAGPPMVITGPRGIGKTSLLDSIRDQARQDGFITAWTSCQRGQPFLADLTYTIDRALRAADALPAPSGWTNALDRIGVEIAVPVVANLGLSLSRSRQEHPRPPAGAISAVEDVLHLAANAAYGSGGRRGVGLLVVIDELHAGAPGELAVLLNALQNLSHDRRENPFALMGAGIPSVGGILTAAATFGERSRWLPLPDLTIPELAEALQAPARDLDVTWTPDALDIAVTAAQHYPHFVQIIGSATWRTARPTAGDTITSHHAHAGAAAGATEITSLYDARWASVPDAERAVLTAMAKAHPTPAGDIARRDIEQALGTDISTHRARLIDKAIIDDTQRGYLRFTLPGFADYIRHHTTPGPPARSSHPRRPGSPDATNARQ